MFCPSLRFFRSTFCPIQRFIFRRFLPSEFFTSTFCRWIGLLPCCRKNTYSKFLAESEPDLLDSSGLLAANRAASQQQQLPASSSPKAAALSAKVRPARPAFEIQYNPETGGAERAVFAPTGGAFRLIEVSASSGSSCAATHQDGDIKVSH
jgi:hypothetical protein